MYRAAVSMLLLTVSLFYFPFTCAAHTATPAAGGFVEHGVSCPTSWASMINDTDPTIVMDLYPGELAALAWNAGASNSLVLVSKGIGPGAGLDSKSFLQLRQLCDGGDPAWSIRCPVPSFASSCTMVDPWTATTIIQCGFNATADVTHAVLSDGTIGWARYDLDASSFFQLSSVHVLRTEEYDEPYLDILRITDGSTIKSWSILDIHPVCASAGVGGVWVAPLGRNLAHGDSRWFVSCEPLWFVLDEVGDVVNTLDDTALFPSQSQPPNVFDYASGSMVYRWLMNSGICLMAAWDTNSTCLRCFSYPDFNGYAGFSLGDGLLVMPNLPFQHQPPSAGAYPQLLFVSNAQFNQSADTLSRVLNQRTGNYARRAHTSLPSWCPQGTQWCMDYSSFFQSLYPSSSGINRFIFTTPNADNFSSAWNDTAWLFLASDFWSPPATPESVQLLVAINPADGTAMRSFRLNTTGLNLNAYSYNGLCGFLEYDAARISAVVACANRLFYVAWNDPQWKSYKSEVSEPLRTE